MLQAVNNDLLGVKNHIHVPTFVKPFKENREYANEILKNDVMPWLKSVFTYLEIDLKLCHDHLLVK